MTSVQSRCESLVLEARDFAYQNGVIKKSSKKDTDVQIFSFTLWPSRLQRSNLDFLLHVQKDYNSLIDAISRNRSLLLASLQKTCQYDDFARRLVEIYNKVEGNTQQCDITLSIVRCDYMLHTGSCDATGVGVEALPKLVEMNTIAAGFVGMSPEMTNIHRTLQVKCKGGEFAKHYSDEIMSNDSTSVVSSAMALAWKEYGRPKAVVLMVVNDGETNIFDQGKLISCLALKHQVNVIKRSFSQLYDTATVESDGRLIVSGVEIAIVYYRTAYDPMFFPTEKEWNVYLLLERSRAIKCPSISYHLAGAKKIQQVINDPPVLESLISDPTVLQNVRSTFTGQYALDVGPEGDKIIEMALKNPQDYVLKPHREGGGNNYFGNDVREKLLEIKDSDERAAYILMDKIVAPTEESVIVTHDKHSYEKISNELGIYGVFVKKGGKVLLNSSASYLLRSKRVGQNEAGMLASGAALNSVALANQ